MAQALKRLFRETTEIGKEALLLQKRWRDHAAGNMPASNTLFAVYGVASSAGRFADNFRYNNSPYPGVLGDIARDCDIVADEQEYRFSAANRRLELTPSRAASGILEHGLSRDRGRKIPMTPAAHRALLAYYAERVALLGEIDSLFADLAKTMFHNRYSMARYRSGIARYLKALGKLCTTLQMR